jgi:hypothetical protein
MRSTSAARTAVPAAAPERQTNLPNVLPADIVFGGPRITYTASNPIQQLGWT